MVLPDTIPGARQRMPRGTTGGGIIDLSGAGAPTVNVTGLGTARLGDRYTDTTAGKLYICTATNSTSTIVWTVVGTQT